MALLNQIPEYIRDKNNNLRVKAPDVYIDDIFDPLFNANAQTYLKDKYNWGWVGNTLAGFAEGVDNALLGQNEKWGILGPGMGILSGFGRSMDKAGDLLIGGVTEGINLLSRPLLNSQSEVSNPLETIFVKDEDYTGSRLLSAMANSMSAFAGGAKTTEQDFTGMWNIPGLGLELALDPGILGGSLTKKFSPTIYDTYKQTGKYSSKDILKNLGKSGVKSAVGEVGQLLSNYDDLMAKVSIDMTVPGLRPLLSKTVDSIFRVFEAQRAKAGQDITYTKEVSPDSPPPTPTEPGPGSIIDGANFSMTDDSLEDMETIYRMTDDVLHILDINPEKHPDLYAKLMKIKEHEVFSKMTLQEFQETASDIVRRQNNMETFKSDLADLDEATFQELKDLLSTKDAEGNTVSTFAGLGTVNPNTSNELPNQFQYLLLNNGKDSEELQELLKSWEGRSVHDVMVSEGLRPGIDFDPRGLEDKIIGWKDYHKPSITTIEDTGQHIGIPDEYFPMDNSNAPFTDLTFTPTENPDLFYTIYSGKRTIQGTLEEVFKKHIDNYNRLVQHRGPNLRNIEEQVGFELPLWYDTLSDSQKQAKVNFEEPFVVTPFTHLEKYKNYKNYIWADKIKRTKFSDEIDFERLAKALDENIIDENAATSDILFNIKNLIRNHIGEGYSTYKTPFILGVSHANRRRKIIEPAIEAYLSEFQDILKQWNRTGKLDLYLKSGVTEDGTEWSEDFWNGLSRAIGTSDDALRKAFNYEVKPSMLEDAPTEVASRKLKPNEYKSSFIFDNEIRDKVSKNPEVVAKKQQLEELKEHLEMLKDDVGYEIIEQEYSFKDLDPSLKDLKRLKGEKSTGTLEYLEDLVNDRLAHFRKEFGEYSINYKTVEYQLSTYLDAIDNYRQKLKDSYGAAISKSTSEIETLQKEIDSLESNLFKDLKKKQLLEDKELRERASKSLNKTSSVAVTDKKTMLSTEQRIALKKEFERHHGKDLTESTILTPESYRDLKAKELHDLQSKGYTYTDLNKLKEKSLEIGDEGSRYVPGLDVLLDVSNKTADNYDKITTVYNAINDFTEFTRKLERNFPELLEHPYMKKLIDLSNRWLEDVELPLKGRNITRSPSGAFVKGLSKFPTDAINARMAQSPKFWLNDAGEFNVSKFRKIRQSATNLSIFPNSFYKNEKVSLVPEQFGYSVKEVKELVDLVTKDADKVFTDKEFAKLHHKEAIASYLNKHKDSNIKEMISYLFHPSVDLDTRRLRLAEIKEGKISMENLPKLIKGPYVTKEVDFNSKIGELLLGERKTFVESELPNPFDYEYKPYTSKTYVDASGKTVKNLGYVPEQDPIHFFSNMPDEYYTKTFVSPKSTAEYTYDEIENSLFKEFAYNDRPIAENIKKTGSVKEVHLFDILQEAKSIKSRNEIKDSASLRSKEVTHLTSNGFLLNRKYNTAKVSKFFDEEYVNIGDVVEGKNLLSSLVQSDGLIMYNIKSDSAQYNRVLKALENNIVKLKASEFLKLNEIRLKNGNTIIALSLNSSNPKLYKQFLKALDSKEVLEDVVFAKAAKYSSGEDFSEMSEFFNAFDDFNNRMHTEFGRTSFNKASTRRVFLESEDNVKYMNSIYKELGIDLSKLQENARAIRAFMENKGTYGALESQSSFRGLFSSWTRDGENLLDTDLEHIVKNNFSTGIYDNINTQTHIDVFVNDNFNIHTYMNDVEDLKRTVFATDEQGKLTGNMYNLTLCSPVRNNEGKVVGLKKYNKFSTTDLQKAWDNQETILVPVDTVAHLDSLCKKDRKMSNKVYKFINKHLTLPFKFGILANPGFLVSNVSDAYFKQAVNMANAYGTSVTSELANVARSLRSVTILNNRFEDVFQKYATHLQQTNPKITPVYLNSQSIVGLPNAKKMFIEYLDSPQCVLSDSEKGIAKFYINLNTVQSVDMFQDTLSEAYFADKVLKGTKYQDPTPLVQRILTGGSKYDPKDISTWGLFNNNPYISMIMKANSGAEQLFRQAAILNDMSHKGYSLDSMCQLLELDAKGERELIKAFEIDMLDAQNAMNAANFHYEASSDLLNAAGTIIPFPTFFLKNFAFWMQILNENPQMIDHFISVQEGLWRGQEDETKKDQFKAEAKGRGAIPVNGQKLSKFFKGIYKPSPLNSMFGAFSLLNNPIDDISYRLNPALKLTTSPLMKDEDVKYRPYSTNQYERNITKADPNFNPLEYALHSMNPYERTINTYLRTPGKFAKGQAQLSDVLPSIFQPDFSKTKK